MAEPGTPTRVGIIGTGAIGGAIIRHASRYPERLQVVAALTRNVSGSSSLPAVRTANALLEISPDIVIEAAGHAALVEHGPAILAGGCDLVALSVGALADRRCEETLREAMTTGRSRLLVASGAIGALDAIGAAAVGGLTSVVHTTRKPARSLMPTEEAVMLSEPKEIFFGPAREAALRFPENVNVSAAVSLAGVGFDRTMVRVIADPEAVRNIHEVEAEGEFGTLRFEISNIPSDDNPKSARLAAMSIVHLLLQRSRPHHLTAHPIALTSH